MTFMIALTAVAPAFAAKTPDPIACGGKLDKTISVNITEKKNDTRKNASGAKITSNAHSADFPGIYFIWDSKQKDNGYLLVESYVFNDYESFILTSKESNTYWDFQIKPQDGQKKTAEGCYVFYVPKVYNNKNINMVFVGDYINKEKEVDPTVVNLGFIGYYKYGDSVLTTSFYWQSLKKGDCIDWDAVDEAYAKWMSDGGLEPERITWQTSGYASYTFPDKSKKCFEDFNKGQVEGYYKEYYLDPGYILVTDDIIAYYAICQLWNDLVWGSDGYGLYKDNVGHTPLTQEQKDLLMPVGIEHRTALMNYWKTDDYNVRYVPFGNVNEDGLKFAYDDWAKYILNTANDGVSLQSILDDLNIDVNEFIKNYDTEGFLTRNGLWE